MSFGIRKFLLLLLSYTKFYYYSLSSLLPQSFPARDFKDNSLLLIKLDEIGDYILFRNLLKYIKNSDRFRSFKITLCGNIAWKGIFDALDINTIDSTIWIDKKKFLGNLIYRNSIINSVRNLHYNFVINCSLSRHFYLDDDLVKNTSAANRIGCKTDLSNQFNWQKRKSDDYYSELIDLSGKHKFEFLRNREYLSKVLETEIPETCPSINIDFEKQEKWNLDNFAVFSPGGRRKYKLWNINNFIKVGNYIRNKYNLKVVLIGSKEDVEMSRKFENNFNKDEILNLTSKTDLTDVINILSAAKIMVTNDSGLAHIAAALKTRTIVLANGTHLGRFFPYPGCNEHVVTLYPPRIEKVLDSDADIFSEFEYRSTLDINLISVEKVINQIDAFLGMGN